VRKQKRPPLLANSSPPNPVESQTNKLMPRYKKDENKCTIYVLKLKQRKWYIGRTSKYDKIKRVLQHFSEKGGSQWTRKYKPVRVEKMIKDETKRAEDKVTKDYMDKYGVANVRGGAYCQLELSEEHLRALRFESVAANDECFICKKKGHFAAQCPEKRFEEEEEEEKEEEYFCEMCEDCGVEFDSENEYDEHRRSCNPKANFDPIVITNNYMPRGAVIRILGERFCEQCNSVSLNGEPDWKTKCYECHSGENDYMPGGGRGHGGGRGRGGGRGQSRTNHRKRACESCRRDISDRPPNHYKCISCFHGSRKRKR
jgi:predicted GIY-YIG superfamily endonuclease